MTKRVTISKEQFQDLYVNKKFTTFQIAKRFSCCQATIWKKFREYSIKPRLPGVERVQITKKQLKDMYVNKNLSTWKIEKITKIPRSTIHRKLKEFKITPRDLADSHITNPRKDFSGDLIEKSYLIGFRLGDLGVRKIYPNSKTITVASGSTIKEQIDLIESLFENYGTVRIKTTNSNKTNIWVGLNETFDFLLSKEVPIWTRDNKETFFSFLAGFSDAEGSFGVYNNQAVFQIGNYNREILLFIKNELEKQGISCGGPYESFTKKYVHREGYPYNQNYFQIRVNKKDSLLKLFESFKHYIMHKNKIKALKKAEDNVIKRNERRLSHEE